MQKELECGGTYPSVESPAGELEYQYVSPRNHFYSFSALTQMIKVFLTWSHWICLQHYKDLINLVENCYELL